MKYLLAFLMLIALPAWAEWVLIADNDKDDRYYIDPQTIRKNGAMRLAWEIEQLAVRHKDGEISRRMRSEYDCLNERYRITSASFHSGVMASGETLATTGETKWRDIPPDTIVKVKLRYVCAK